MSSSPSSPGGILTRVSKIKDTLTSAVRTGVKKTVKLNQDINQSIKIKDSRIYQENEPNIYVMNDNLISKNLHDLGNEINNYYNKNMELNRKT
jgi:hypothetical protein